MAQQRRGQGVNPAETEQQQRGLFGMGGGNNEDQQQQTAPVYQSYAQYPTGTDAQYPAGTEHAQCPAGTEQQQQRRLFVMGGGNNEDQQQQTAPAYQSHAQYPAGTEHAQCPAGTEQQQQRRLFVMGGGNNEDQQQQTAPAYQFHAQYPAATHGVGEGMKDAGQGMQPAYGYNQKKDFTDKIEDKLPARNEEDQRQQTVPAYQSHAQCPVVGYGVIYGVEEGMKDAGQGMQPGFGDNQKKGFMDKNADKLPRRNEEDQRRQTVPPYQSHAQYPVATYGVEEGMKHAGQGMQPGSGDNQKKDFTDKIADKLPSHKKEDQQQQIAPAYESHAQYLANTYGVGEGMKHEGQGMRPGSRDNQKKGFMDKIADKLPGRNKEDQHQQTVPAYQSHSQYPTTTDGVGEGMNHAGQGMQPSFGDNQKMGFTDKITDKLPSRNKEDQQQQIAPAYQSHPQYLVVTDGIGEGMKHAGQGMQPSSRDNQRMGFTDKIADKVPSRNKEDHQQQTTPTYQSHPQNPVATHGIGEGRKHSSQGMQPASSDDHKKGFMDKIMDKLPGYKKEDQQQQIAPAYQSHAQYPTTTDGVGEGMKHVGQGMHPDSGENQKKGFTDKIADKHPSCNKEDQHQQTTLAYQSLPQYPIATHGVGEGMKHAGQGMEPAYGYNQKTGFMDKLPCRNKEDQQQQTTLEYQSHPQNSAITHGAGEGMKHSSQGLQPVSRDDQRKGSTDKIMDKLPGNKEDQQQQTTLAYQSHPQNPIATHGVGEGMKHSSQELQRASRDDQKKGSTEKIMDKLPSRNKEDQQQQTTLAYQSHPQNPAATHGIGEGMKYSSQGLQPESRDDQKKGSTDKIMDKLPSRK